MPECKPARFRRILAWILDFALCSLLPYCALGIPDLLGVPSLLMLPIGIVATISWFAAFLCRDWLLGGRSIGKRILGLSIVDRQTGEAVTGATLVLRNLFFFIYPVDGCFLLFSGRSIGERTTHTAVIRARIRCKIRPKPLLIVTAIVLAIAIPFCIVITAAMNLTKKTESYQISYDYLVQSEAFAAQGADPADIAMTGFSQRSQLGAETIASYTFQVEGTTYTVTCHPSGESWAVCAECTDFD